MKSCCSKCISGKPCLDKDKKEYSIEKTKPKKNIRKMEQKLLNDPLYGIFGKEYIIRKNNIQ